MKYCCEKLKSELDEDSPLIDKKIMIYDKQRRCYGLSYDGTLKIYQPIEYCPFCGTKFPKDLVEEFWDTLMEEYGVEYYPTDENYDPNRPLPPEFQTDEWWIKRGL